MASSVLMIEDNVQNRYRATYLPENHEFTVVAALDGLQGIALADTLRGTFVAEICACLAVPAAGATT